MLVRNVNKIRSITLPSGQKLAPDDEGQTPETGPIKAMINGGDLLEVHPRAEAPIPVKAAPPVEAPKLSQVELDAVIAKMLDAKPKELIENVAKAEKQELPILKALKAKESRKKVLEAVEKRIKELS